MKAFLILVLSLLISSSVFAQANPCQFEAERAAVLVEMLNSVEGTVVAPYETLSFKRSGNTVVVGTWVFSNNDPSTKAAYEVTLIQRENAPCYVVKIESVDEIIDF